MARVKNILNMLWDKRIVRRCIYFTCFIGLWFFVYSTSCFSERLLPSPITVLAVLFDELINGNLIEVTTYSLVLIGKGLLISFALAAVFTAITIVSKAFKDILESVISVIDPLPGIALLPLAILWIGIGEASIIFVIVHSVLWPVLINTMSGFDGVSRVYREIGENIGLKPIDMILSVYVPASFPSILAGIKTGWARAWRALISAEMVFGATGMSGGLGWDIYVKRSFMNLPGMFASLLVIMIIGILIEDILFINLENRTIKKWGMRI